MIKRFLILAAAVMTTGLFGADDILPRINLERSYDHGGTERISLRCTPDVHGNQEFFCELQRYRNGVEVATTGVYSKQTKEIISAFFDTLPRRYRQPSNRGANRDAPVKWEVAYKKKTSKGVLPRIKKTKSDKRLARAVLSLEGSLTSLFFR